LDSDAGLRAGVAGLGLLGVAAVRFEKASTGGPSSLVTENGGRDDR